MRKGGSYRVIEPGQVEKIAGPGMPATETTAPIDPSKNDDAEAKDRRVSRRSKRKE